jgi:hypothetical protein
MKIRIPLGLIVFSAVLITSVLGLFLPGRFILPLLQFVPPWLLLVHFSRRGRLGRGIIWLLAWVLMLNVVMVCLVVIFPARSAGIYHASAYWHQMQLWIRTGSGMEGDWQQFLPHHLLQVVKLGLASLVSGGGIALLMGVLQLDYMNYYVGKVVIGSDQPVKAFFLGWHLWSVCRVIGYIIICAVLAQPLLARLLRFRIPAKSWFYLALGCGFVFLDLLLKYTLNSGLRAALAELLQ